MMSFDPQCSLFPLTSRWVEEWSSQSIEGLSWVVAGFQFLQDSTYLRFIPIPHVWILIESLADLCLLSHGRLWRVSSALQKFPVQLSGHCPHGASKSGKSQEEAGAGLVFEADSFFLGRLYFLSTVGLWKISLCFLDAFRFVPIPCDQ